LLALVFLTADLFDFLLTFLIATIVLEVRANLMAFFGAFLAFFFTVLRFLVFLGPVGV